MNRKPSWLKTDVLGKSRTLEMVKLLKKYNLHTVCQSALCPNRGECFERGTATFMILGNKCTRNCRFCAIEPMQTLEKNPIDKYEPKNVAKASAILKLKYIVITSVTRDDLQDGGAEQFAETIYQCQKLCPDAYIEVLTPDFAGNKSSIKRVIFAKPNVFNHNLETISRLYSAVRPQAIYNRSLNVLNFAKSLNSNLITKTGIMVGLGEHKDEVIELMKHARAVGVDILTIGQYIAPTKMHYPVKEYLYPQQFLEYKDIALDLGFLLVQSGPLVRSSYLAEQAISLIEK